MNTSNELNEMWTLKNQLTAARDRHRARAAEFVGDVTVIKSSSALEPMIAPLVEPKIDPMSPPLVRRMGETTIEQQRRHRGTTNLWEGTPIAGMPSVLGDPEIIDVGQMLAGWDRVGWEWSQPEQCLKAFISRGEKTWVVKVPRRHLQRIFNWAAARDGGAERFQEPTLNGLFKKLGRGLKSAAKAPGKLIRNPRKFVRDATRKIKEVVKKVGQVALKVASSPAFGAIMAGMAAVPPLTAIGGAGLAAFAAARTAKPFIEGGAAVAKGIKGMTKDKADARAKQGQQSIRNSLAQMPPPARALMVAALQSQQAGSSLTAAEQSKARAARSNVIRALRYSRGALSRI